MEDLLETALIYKIVGISLYLGILLVIGVMASRKMRDVRDYFAGGKQLGFLSVAFSARATGESGWLLLGLTGMGAMVGAKAFWVVIGETLGVAIAWFFMSRRFHRLTQRYDSVTIPDYLESRFRDKAQLLRRVSVVSVLVFVLVYVSAQIDATGVAFETFVGVDYHVGALIGFAIVMLYIGAGGFVAVVWSDVFQGMLMFLGLVILPVVSLLAVGGPGAMSDGLVAIDPALMSIMGAGAGAGGGLGALDIVGIIGLAMIGLGYLGSPQIFVRFLALKDEGEIKKGAAVAIAWTVLADSGAVLIGMTGRVMFDGMDLGNGGQDVLPIMVEALMPAFFVGLYIAIVLSAIMSTIDSLLVLAGSALVRDWWQKIRHPDLDDAKLIGASRWVTLTVAVLGLAIAFIVSVTVPDRSIFWFVLVGFYGLAATFCPTIIMSIFWRGMTARGALWAMAAGFVTMLTCEFLLPQFDGIGPWIVALTSLPPAFAAGFLAGWLGSISDPQRGAMARECGPDITAASQR